MELARRWEAQDPAALPAPRRPEAPAPAPVLRILLADDNAVNQEVGRLLLRRLGYTTVDTVANGHEALAALRSRPYDVVLMDVHMPLVDGLAATREIRAHLPATRQPHIVAMTAGALPSDREACTAAGMDDFFTKPFRADDLRAVLASAARRRDLPHALTPAPTVRPEP